MGVFAFVEDDDFRLGHPLNDRQERFQAAGAVTKVRLEIEKAGEPTARDSVVIIG